MAVARASMTYATSTPANLAVTQAAPGTYAGHAPQVYTAQMPGGPLTATAAAPYPAAGYGAPGVYEGYQLVQGDAYQLQGGFDGGFQAAAFQPQAAFDGGFQAGFPPQGAQPGVAPPQPPRRQTDGLPTPEDVNVQKAKYAQALDSQLEAGKRTIEEHTAQAKAILRQQAEEKKMAFALQVEEQLMAKEMGLDQDTHQKLMELHQAAYQQKAKLEQQASNLTLDFRQKQMLEQMEHKRYEMQLKQCDMRERMSKAYQDKQGMMNPYDAAGAGHAEQYQQQPMATAPVPYPAASPHGAGGSAQAPAYDMMPTASPTAGTTPHGMAHQSGQYGSIQAGQFPPEASGSYGAPPTQYAQPQTSMGAPPTANVSGHYSHQGSMGPPATSMGAHQMPQTVMSAPPQTVLPQGH